MLRCGHWRGNDRVTVSLAVAFGLTEELDINSACTMSVEDVAAALAMVQEGLGSFQEVI